jgi:hypothetical protein
LKETDFISEIVTLVVTGILNAEQGSFGDIFFTNSNIKTFIKNIVTYLGHAALTKPATCNTNI